MKRIDKKCKVIRNVTDIPFRRNKWVLGDKFCFKKPMSIKTRIKVEKKLKKEKFAICWSGMNCIVVK